VRNASLDHTGVAIAQRQRLTELVAHRGDRRADTVRARLVEDLPDLLRLLARSAAGWPAEVDQHPLGPRGDDRRLGTDEHRPRTDLRGRDVDERRLTGVEVLKELSHVPVNQRPGP
jgi:hypothetical protein